MPEQHIIDRLNTLEAKIDKLNSSVSSIQGQWIIRPCDEHNRRIMDLERQTWKMAGVIGLVSAMPGIVALFSMIMR
jgi:hypothetical protein